MIIKGDALTELKKLDSEIVDCIITSPPYWALRDYNIEGQIGQENTIDEYVNKLTEIFNECKRVLKKYGTCWIVLGDTFAGSGNGAGDRNITGKCKSTKGVTKFKPPNINIPDKSQCMIPERFAIKMIDNGWILRNKIIWHKPNCMPSSATDRFTVDYEYIYFFVKSKKYYFKTQYEPFQTFENRPFGVIRGREYEYQSKYINTPYYGQGKKKYEENNIQNPSDVKRRVLDSMKNQKGRIKRAVWKINTKPFKEAHFAVFPEELVKQCMDAGCPEQGTVLDPFSGAGTTGLAAVKNNRQYIGIELNPDYIEIANKRINPYLQQTKLVV